jgi:penicillin-binding protein 1A
MEYEHGGSPVAGGTFPAEIFHDFMTSWIDLRQARRLERAAKREDEDGTSTDVAPAVPVSPTDAAPTEAAPTDEGTGGTNRDQGGGTGTGGNGGGQNQAPPQNQQPAEPPSTPAQPETPPPTGGGGGGVSPGGTP